MSDTMECITRTSDIVVFLRARSRGIEATIAQTRNRLRRSSDSAWRSQGRIAAMQESLDMANNFLENSSR